MSYSNELEERIGNVITGWENISFKKMFGGICHLLNGNMFAGVYKDYLILRLGEKGAKKALKLNHIRPMDITGKPMKGWVMVGQAEIKNERELEEWLKKARKFVKTLPVK